MPARSEPGAGEPVPASARRLGLLAALTAVAIYAANFVTTRYSVTNGFSSAELVALRYLVAGTLLLPRFLRAGVRDVGGLGWLRALAILCLVGAPYMFVFNLGLAFAPRRARRRAEPGRGAERGVRRDGRARGGSGSRGGRCSRSP